MSRPRLGDRVISAQMKPHIVVQVDLEEVRAEAEESETTTERSFKIDALEQVEEGVWQETEQ